MCHCRILPYLRYDSTSLATRERMAALQELIFSVGSLMTIANFGFRFTSAHSNMFLGLHVHVITASWPLPANSTCLMAQSTLP